ncbi:hypothetical protein [Ochrovirga pacifica]|uniref:hypothetical protein n=1 Tax=Ochrovirga pacifica TaxID=1042376 RepID=UPI0011119B78|nr:hypothetical protein [Ochrovirga pacifica]
MKVKLHPFIYLMMFLFLCNCSSNSEDEFIPPATVQECTKTCDTGFTLNEETCECEEDPVEACNITCDAGYRVNDENCECEKIPDLTEGIKYGDNYIVFQPEITKSNLDQWKLRTQGTDGYYPEHADANIKDTDLPAIGNSYLEFTGNNLNGGTPTSPLKYTFVCPKTTKYRLVMRMLQPLESCTVGSNHCADNGYVKGDKRNDCWVKLEGDFTSGNHIADDELKKTKKFWGRGVRKWGSCHMIEAHNKAGSGVNAKALYNLKKGEVYTFTIAGRAQGCSIDYVMFYEESLETSLELTIENHTDIAVEFPEEYRPDTDK